MSPSLQPTARTTVQQPALRALALACALLSGCAAVGPNFLRPQAPSAQAYIPGPVGASTAAAAVAGGAAESFVLGDKPQAAWWTAFNSPELDALVECALKAHPSIEAAQAALRQAQENVAAQRGYFFPVVAANYSPQRTKIAGNLGGNSPGVQGNGGVISTTQNTPANLGGTGPFNAPVIYNFHTAQITVGYSPDVFGGVRRQLEATQAQADYQRWQLEATSLTLAANVVAAAVQEALLRQQIAVAESVIESSTQARQILERQLKAGYASRVDLALQETALAQTRQALPPLRKQLEQTRNLLRTLAGGRGDLELPQTFNLDRLDLPRQLPLSLPSDLVRQRPDVLAAEAQLQAASAQVGIAIANRLPQLSIDASLGGAASRVAEMFWPSGRFFNLVGNLTMPLFDAGTLKHRQLAAEEGLRQADAQYRATVLGALQNVADALYAIQYDADALAFAVDQERSTRTALDLARRQLDSGYVDRLTLLTAQQSNLQARMTLAQARAARLGDTVALFQALGGSW